MNLNNEVLNEEATNVVEETVKKGVDLKEVGIVGGTVLVAGAILYGAYRFAKDHIHLTNPFAKKDQASEEETETPVEK